MKSHQEIRKFVESIENLFTPSAFFCACLYKGSIKESSFLLPIVFCLFLHIEYLLVGKLAEQVGN